MTNKAADLMRVASLMVLAKDMTVRSTQTPDRDKRGGYPDLHKIPWLYARAKSALEIYDQTFWEYIALNPSKFDGAPRAKLEARWTEGCEGFAKAWAPVMDVEQCKNVALQYCQIADAALTEVEQAVETFARREL